MSSEQNHQILVVDVITFVTGLPTNALAFYTFIRKVRQKATPMDILLLNLTTSHLLFLLFLPFKMKETVDNMRWSMTTFLCPVTKFVFHTTIYNSTLFLTAISVDRYLGAAFPVKYKLKRRPLYAVVASVFIWLISMGHISIVPLMHLFHSNSTRGLSCYRNFSREQLEVLLPVRFEIFLFLFCVPGIICSFCYINLIRILFRLPNISLRKRRYAIGLALMTLLVFIICFSPHNVSHVVGFVTKESPKWHADALLCSTLNACLDPFIYYFSSSALRATSKDILGRLGRRVKELCCGPEDTNSSPPCNDCPPSTNNFTESSERL